MDGQSDIETEDGIGQVMDAPCDREATLEVQAREWSIAVGQAATVGTGAATPVLEAGRQTAPYSAELEPDIVLTQPHASGRG